jgi:hypothetical protein
VENTPEAIHAVKYTGNTPSPEIHPKIHPPGWEIHRGFCFRAAAHLYTASSAKRKKSAERSAGVLVLFSCI